MGQSASGITSGITPPGWRWCGPPAASSPTWHGERLDASTSRSALAGAPGVHGEMLEIVKSVGDTGGLLMDPKDLAVRVIPCLDVDDGRVVKGVNFENLRDAGDPVELAAVYDAEGADELTFLDVTASSSGRATMLDVVRRTAEQVFIPLTVGGGVRSVADVDVLLRAGADKVVGQHRRHRAAGTAGRAVPAVRVAVHRVVGRRPDRAAG